MSSCQIPRRLTFLQASSKGFLTPLMRRPHCHRDQNVESIRLFLQDFLYVQAVPDAV